HLSLMRVRSAAWCARGFRGPLRDFVLSDEVKQTHYGRAYGLERAGDMLGAVSGPLAAVGRIWAGVAYRSVILWAIVPGLAAVAAVLFLVRERAPVEASTSAPAV